MEWSLWGLIFLVGAVIGSFLNVCIYRIPLDLSIIRPGSSCPACKTAIAPYDNVPILSFLLLFGRCRKCRAPISWRYPLVELLNGLGYLLLVWMFGLDVTSLVYAIFYSALLVVTFIDIDYQIIPDVITYPGIVLGIGLSVFLPVGIVDSLIGFLVGGGLFYLVAEASLRILKQDGMGGGDIKLIAMIGAFLGWQSVLLTIFLSSLGGALLGGAFMLIKGWGRKTPIPFGPFLALGAIIAMFWGAPIMEWYVGLSQ